MCGGIATVDSVPAAIGPRHRSSRSLFLRVLVHGTRYSTPTFIGSCGRPSRLSRSGDERRRAAGLRTPPALVNRLILLQVNTSVLVGEASGIQYYVAVLVVSGISKKARGNLWFVLLLPVSGFYGPAANPFRRSRSEAHSNSSRPRPKLG
jgi:hypothetical protein